MDFRVYVIIEMPVLDKKLELFLPIDRRVHEIVTLLQRSYPDFAENFYEHRYPILMSKSTGKIYDLNDIIKNTDIKNGTRLVLI